MNARELHDTISENTMRHTPLAEAEEETILRALRLLAAAEANDGSIPEMTKAVQEGRGIELGCQFERERNGLAARVRELENECSAADIYGRTSASHGFINAPKWNELADETKSLYRESAARSKP